MIASQIFDKIVNNIRDSGLNFSLQLSPFAATISLKRSLVKDMSGRIVVPPQLQSDSVDKVKSLQQKNYDLEHKLETLGLRLDSALQDLDKANSTISLLKIKNEAYINPYKEEQENNIGLFYTSSEKLENMDINLQCENSECFAVENVKDEDFDRVDVTEAPTGDKTDIVLEHPWNNIQLTFSPKEASGGTCVHPNQCVIRQPFGPPLPSVTFLKNEKSKYDQHMMRLSDFHGCIKCFSVENDNYGCDHCTWLKWWFKWHGSLHGFPDVHPSTYRRYL